MGVNQQLFDPAQHRIVTAASCTTNCLAPVVKVIHENLGIKHGSITTIHNLTNTQSILDQPHKDLRRARASGSNLIPTTDRKSTRLNSSHVRISYAVFCLKKKKKKSKIKYINNIPNTVIRT